MAQQFTHSSRIPAPPERVFAWHTRDGALERLTPPWENVRVRRRDPGITPGSQVDLELRIGPFRQRWLAEHDRFESGRLFRDVQVDGPFARWEHTHLMESDGAGGCTMEDRIEYALPLEPISTAVAGWFVRSNLERTFAYRHRILARDLELHADLPESLTVAVSGASGSIGSAFVPFLTTGGHTVKRLVRRPPTDPAELDWQAVDAGALAGCDAIVHLAGAGVADRRWSPARKRMIAESREAPTRRLAEAIARMERKPRVLVCASAIGYYGDRGDELVAEDSAAGEGFLAKTTAAWEEAARPAAEAGVRVVHLRFGVVLTPKGGALGRMLPAYRFGLGARLGSGRQFLSWITLDDAVAAIHRTLHDERLAGPVNAVAPRPVRQVEFHRTLARVLGRPAFTAAPAPVLHAMLGKEMAEALLLTGARVEPKRLQDAGFGFAHPDLESGLRHLLGRTRSDHSGRT